MTSFRKNADRLDKLFDYLHFQRPDGSVSTFFIGESGYFLFGVEPHARFLCGDSSLEKLQKYRWLRIDQATPEAQTFADNGFLLFYDKSGLVRLGNELEWLRNWRTKRPDSYKEKNPELKAVPKEIIRGAIEKMKLWKEKRTEAFPLPKEWNSVKLTTKQLAGLFRLTTRKKGKVSKAKKSVKKQHVKKERSASKATAQEDVAGGAQTSEAPGDDFFENQWVIEVPRDPLDITQIDYIM